MDDLLARAKTEAGLLCHTLHRAHDDCTLVESYILMPLINEAESLRMKIYAYCSARNDDRKNHEQGLGH